MDYIDEAAATEELLRQAELAAQQARREAGPRATGACLFCDATLTEAGQRWCDSYCRDDWEREQRALKRNPQVDE